MTSTLLEQRRTGLYRFFGADGGLLYIGVTCDLPDRMESHRGDKPWWTKIQNVTIEWFDNRSDALKAERQAIAAEGPRYNIQHNRPNFDKLRRRIAARKVLPSRNWTFESVQSGLARNVPLWLEWELDGFGLADDCEDDATPFEILATWHTRYVPSQGEAERNIYWFVRGPGIVEYAPFASSWGSGGMNFLTNFTWPYDRESGEDLNWASLRVREAEGRGFFYAATGWRPAALQAKANIGQILEASAPWRRWAQA